MNVARLLLIISLAGCLGIFGCVDCKLTINTNPAGALVLLNDEEIGISPVTTSFNWYGDYNITIRKQGFSALNTHRKLSPPWYDYFPFDFFADCLYPGRIVDSYEWSFGLTPEKQINRQDLIQDAQQLKSQASP